MEHRGSLDDLRTIITGCGYEVSEERPQQQGGVQFRTSDGAKINWYRSTGRVQAQGQSDIKEKFENRLGLTTAERSSPHRAEYKM